LFDTFRPTGFAVFVDKTRCGNDGSSAFHAVRIFNVGFEVPFEVGFKVLFDAEDCFCIVFSVLPEGVTVLGVWFFMGSLKARLGLSSWR
jgi:hypothetical protein